VTVSDGNGILIEQEEHNVSSANRRACRRQHAAPWPWVGQHRRRASHGIIFTCDHGDRPAVQLLCAVTSEQLWEQNYTRSDPPCPFPAQLFNVMATRQAFEYVNIVTDFIF